MDGWPLVVVALGCSLIWAAAQVTVVREVAREWAAVMTGLIDHTTCIAVAKTGVESAPEAGEGLVGEGGFIPGAGEDDDEDDDDLEHGESYTPTCTPKRLGF
jgi:hypothetical protein